MRHRGLSLQHKVSYLLWFCCFWKQKNNTFWPLYPSWTCLPSGRLVSGSQLYAAH
jgi:hypothetical protein